MADKKVVTKGGGQNLYKVSEYDGIYYITQVDPGIFSDSKVNLGQTRNMKDAIDIIRSFSGREIDSMTDW